MSDFIHLHNHMEGSLADSALRSKEAVRKAKELNMKALAITDHGYLFKVIDFYKDCKSAGIKPIIGLETYIAPRKNTLKEHGIDDANYHLILLCENNIGYSNLMKIASDAATDGFYYKPRTDKHFLKDHHEGLIATSACLGGEVQKFFLEGKDSLAKETAIMYDNLFGRGNFFLELQDHGMAEQHAVNPKLIALSKETGIPLIATNDCHYLTRDSFEAHDVLMAIQAKTDIWDDKRKKYPNDQFYFKTGEEMESIFSHVPEAISNTAMIAERCNVTFEFGVNKIPEFKVPPPHTPESYLREQVEKGIKDRYGEVTDEIKERVDHELNVVIKMQYTDYFLIVWDLFNFCRSRDILIGPGRGSGAGSILLYSLYVTHIDPLRYGLLFERFLDESRISMPDVDSDVPDDRRQEVIDYIIERYGQKSICQIITFGSAKAKAAVGAVGRAILLTEPAMRASKLIPAKDPNMTLKKAMTESVDFLTAYNNDMDIKKIVDLAIQIEGLPTYMSTHAAGVLVTDEKGLMEHVPLCKTEKGIVAQYNMNNLDELGLLKLDILGLRTLSVIMNAISNIRMNHDVVINPYDLYSGLDNKAFETIANGHTQGVFQLEGGGMTKFMKDLIPSQIEEIIAGVALYRPGPMDMIPQFIESKRDPSKIRYDFKELEDVMKETYGVLCYQEQCMKSAIVIADYSKSDSDSLRRAIGKKKADLMKQHRQFFIYGRKGEGKDIPGGIAMGHDEKELTQFYDKLEKFGNYCFNKSHAACYAVLAYATAWLKTYYPVEFMSSLMDAWSKDHKKLSMYMRHCIIDLEIEVVHPSINQSIGRFLPTKDGRIISSLFVKDVGADVLESMIKERGDGFLDTNDFIIRGASIVGKSAIKAFASIGAFDEFRVNRSSILAAVDDIVDGLGKWRVAKKRYYDNKNSRRKEEPKLSEWISDDILPNIKEYPSETKLKLEKRYAGMYLTGNPLDKFSCSISSFSNFSLQDLDYDVDETTGSITMSDNVTNGQTVQIVAQLSMYKPFTSKEKKELMAECEIKDINGYTAKMMAFHNSYMTYRDILVEDEIYQIVGKVSIRPGEEPIIILSKIKLLQDTIYKRLIFTCEDKYTIKRFIDTIPKMRIRGSCPIYVRTGNVRILLKRIYWVDHKLFENNFPEEFMDYIVTKEW